MTDLADKTRAELPTLAHAIAAELGEGWRADVVHEHHVRVIGPNDETLTLNVAWNSKGQMKIGGGYPIGTARLWGMNHFDIGVSTGRGARVIAREITRRLLPDYLPELERVKGMIAADQARQDEQRRVADLIAASCPNLRRAKDGVTFDLYDRDDVSLRVEVREGGRVYLDRCYGDIGTMLLALMAIDRPAAQS